MTFRNRKSDVLPHLSIVFVYLASRYWWCFKSGIDFDYSSLIWGWQYLDLKILKEDLVTAIFYQHAQPPLFNAFIGIVLKIFPIFFKHAFTLVFYLCSLAIYFLIYKILYRLKFDSWMAFGIATLFIVSPEAILYENHLFYTWPVTALLTLAAYALLRYEKTLRIRDGVVFIISIGAVCLTRSMFHLVYLAFCIVLVLLVSSPGRKKMAAVSIFVFLGVGVLFFKNYVLFGVFGSSSWMGMSLARMTEQCEVSNVVTPEVTLVRPFSPLIKYPEKYRRVPVEYSQIPVLTAEIKRNGRKNLNHYGYIGISNEYLKNSLNLISNDFSGYLKSVKKAWINYSTPAWNFHYLKENKKKIQNYIDMVSLHKYRFYIERELLGIGHGSDFPVSTMLVIPALLAFIAVFFIVDLIKFICGRETFIRQRIFFGFMVLTVFYVAILGNCFEYAENNRFRVQTDTLLYIAVVIAVREIWRALRCNTVSLQGNVNSQPTE